MDQVGGLIEQWRVEMLERRVSEREKRPSDKCPENNAQCTPLRSLLEPCTLYKYAAVELGFAAAREASSFVIIIIWLRSFCHSARNKLAIAKA